MTSNISTSSPKVVPKRFTQGKNGRAFEIIKAKEWTKGDGIIEPARIVLVAWFNSKGEIAEYSTNVQEKKCKEYDKEGKMTIVEYNENLEPCFLYGHYEFWLNLKAAEEDFLKREA